MLYPDNEADTERAAWLDAALQATADELNGLDADITERSTWRAEVRVVFGRLFKERREMLPRGQKVAFLEAQARAWGFEQSTAYNYLDYALVHDSDPVRFDFPTLGIMTVQRVAAERRRISGNEAGAGRITERRKAQSIANAVAAAGLLLARLDQTDLRQWLHLQQQGIEPEALRDWLAGAVFRRGPSPPLTEEEKSRGLSKLFVDSGAFEVFSSQQRGARRVEINLDEYCDRLLANPWITTYANLDVINPREPEDAAEAGYRNFDHMRSRGLNPIPVYHLGEDISWLRKYIDEGCDYIGLSPLPGSTVPRNWVFFKECFANIQNAGRPIKTHAFGVAHEATLLNYPFTSADSATWLLRPIKFSKTDISRIGDGKWRLSLYKEGRIDIKRAAQIYLEAWDANRIERQIREAEGREDFTFYVVVSDPKYPWWLPALWTVQHRNALVPNRPHWNPAFIKRFIDDPASILTQLRYAEKLTLLERMRRKHINNLSEQRRVQEKRDEQGKQDRAAALALLRARL